MTIQRITSQADIEQSSVSELVDWLKEANQSYRVGGQSPADALYDAARQHLSYIDPMNELLAGVEPEPTFGSGKVVHSKPMLSLEKVYSTADINKFIARVAKSAKELGIDPETLEFKLMSKLDGIAAKRENGVWATRGDGLVGNVISDSFDKGIKVLADQPDTIGEIVMLKSYAASVGVEDDVARNIVSGILSSDNVKDFGQKALDAGAIHFVAFDQLQSHIIQGADWAEQVSAIEYALQEGELYPTDGIVITVLNPQLCEHMGENSREPRYSVAKKTQGEAVTATVTEVVWQVGRTGVLTPVVCYEPIKVGGVMNTKATGHNAAALVNNKIGVGAQILIVRSGSVIPTVIETITPADVVIVPEVCPSCSSPAEWSENRSGERVTVNCTNTIDCPDQLRERLVYFFKTIDAKNFGGSACAKLVAAGLDTPRKVYDSTNTQLISAGFGPGQARNLSDELDESLARPLQDFKLLAAFGVHHLGRADSKKILIEHDIYRLFALTASDLQAIDGFAEVTSHSITRELMARMGEILNVLSLKFNLIHSSAVSTPTGEAKEGHGKRVVFTGKLSQTRGEMCAEAESFGLVAQSSLGKSSDWLVVGEKAGASKMAKAEQYGARVLTEAEYRAKVS